MSASDRDRVAVVRRCVEEGLSRGVAAERLGIGVRQVKRLVRAWRREGDAGLVSRRRGRPSNNRLPEERRARIAALLAGKYEGFVTMREADSRVMLAELALQLQRLETPEVVPFTGKAPAISEIRVNYIEQ